MMFQIERFSTKKWCSQRSWKNYRNEFRCKLFWLYPSTRQGHTDVWATKPENINQLILYKQVLPNFTMINIINKNQ